MGLVRRGATRRVEIGTEDVEVAQPLLAVHEIKQRHLAVNKTRQRDLVVKETRRRRECLCHQRADRRQR
jgi:hypothetical protein